VYIQVSIRLFRLFSSTRFKLIILIFGYTLAMKEIEQEKLDQLMEIIKPAPALRIAHMCDGEEEMIGSVSRFCVENGYEYQINCMDASASAIISERYREVTEVRCIHFNLARPKYMTQGKFYEYLFVTADIPESLQGSFLKKAHGIIKNDGLILIFLPKKAHIECDVWMQLLETHYYVASSLIDDLFENYSLIISKKMHGWGE